MEAANELFATERGHFFELKHLLLEVTRPSSRNTSPAPPFVTKERALLLLSHIYAQLQRAIRTQTTLAHSKIPSDLEELTNLSEASQTELVRWIFTNEDKVWRARGGRPGEETLSQFVALLKARNAFPCVPGVICFFERPERDAQGSIRDARVCGYLLGEWVHATVYEVITTWTSPHCRGMGIALQMYATYFALILAYELQVRGASLSSAAKSQPSSRHHL